MSWIDKLKGYFVPEKEEEKPGPIYGPATPIKETPSSRFYSSPEPTLSSRTSTLTQPPSSPLADKLAKMVFETKPVQRFEIGAGQSNKTEVRPGPTLAGDAALNRGEELKTIPFQQFASSRPATSQATASKDFVASKIEQERQRPEASRADRWASGASSLAGQTVGSPLRALIQSTLLPIEGGLKGEKYPSYTPKSDVARFFLGDETLKSGGTILEETGKRFADAKTTGEFAGAIGIGGLAIGSIAADAVPFAGGTKATLKTLTKEILEQAAKRGKPIAREVAEQLAKKELAKMASKTAPRFAKAEAPVPKAISAPEPPRFAKAEAPVPKIVDAATKERKFVSSVKKQVADPELRISGEYVPRSTDELSIKARNLIKDDIDQAERIVLGGEKIDDNTVAMAAELIKHYNNSAKAATTKSAKNLYYDKIADVTNKVAKELTEEGRTIQAASIMSRDTPEGVLRFAARDIQKYNDAIKAAKPGFFGPKKLIPELTGAETQNIITKIEDIQGMADGVGKARAFREFTDELAERIPSTTLKKVINVWKAGLLTGIQTSGLNTMSNLFHGVSEVAKDVPTAIVDNLLYFATGKRTMGLTTKGLGSGFSEGVQKGLDFMKTGFDGRNIAAKLDYKKVNFGKSKVGKAIQVYEENVFRLMGAQDQPFYYAAKARSVASQAIAKAKNKGLKGKKAQEFIDNLMANPTDDMLRYATQDAEIAVFQNRTMIGEQGKRFQRLAGGAGEVVVPFARTPAAVAMQLINYSPAGIVKTLVENAGKGRFNQRQFAQAMGRGITGTGIMYLGMKLFDKGMISLGYPSSEREREQWELEGKKPNSIKVNGKWRNVAVLGPGGMTLVLGGYFQRGINETGSHVAALAQTALGGAKILTEQTFLKGMNQFLGAIDQPDKKGPTLLANLIGSTVPSFIAATAKAGDQYERETNYSKAGLFGSFKSRVPGLRQTLEPRVSVLGELVPRGGNLVETMIDPSRPSKIKSTEVIEELKRLGDTEYIATPAEFANEKSYDVLSGEQKTTIQERAGTILEGKLNNLFADPEYKKLEDEEKKKIINNFTDSARLVARAEAMQEMTQGLRGAELDSKIAELKQQGFLTKGVFDKWKDIYDK
uniref:Putative structural protein n=1 Tax=viral metagenome TaxID=1070528 RepID=A0A6M3KHT8_9ZZZZ